MCLADLLLKAKFPFSIAHVNYQLRGDESDDDQQFVIDFAWKNHIPVYTKNIPIEHLDGNTQENARIARYDWFNLLLIKSQASLVLTAHHANDLLEGTLLKWYRGIPWSDRFLMPKSHGHIYRPLLDIPSDQIEAYANTHNIDYRTDSSNLDDNKYDRNFFRQQVLQPLKMRNPHALDTLLQRVHDEEQDRTLFLFFVKKYAAQIITDQKDGWTLPLDHVLLEESPNKIQLLKHLLKNQHIAPPPITQLLNASTGAHWELPGGTLWLDRNQLTFTSKKESVDGQQTTPKQIVLQQPASITLPNKSLIKIEEVTFDQDDYTGTNRVFLEKERFPGPWIWRTWSPGDFIRPIGMNGQIKKIQDVFTDNKIPAFKKDHIYMLEINGEIIWIPGLKISELARCSKPSARGWALSAKARH
jgi:tRNA(Ile)-lysidine synthase